DDHRRASLLALAGGDALRRNAQGERLHRPLRLVAEVLLALPDPVLQHAAAGQGTVWLRLSGDQPGALAQGLRGGPLPRRSAPEDHDREREETARAGRLKVSYQYRV